jgi:hypothetical protein
VTKPIPPQDIDVFIHLMPGWEDFTPMACNCDMSGAGWIPVQKASVKFVGISAEDLIARQLVMARDERAKLVEEFTKQLADTDEKISKLLAISFNPSTEARS